MSAPHDERPDQGQEGTPSEEELRARLEEELKSITVKDVLLQTLVTLVNLGGHRLGVSETARESRDLEQTRLAIEAVRSLLPVLEADPHAAQQVRPVRDALSQLQLAYAQQVGDGETAAGGESAKDEAAAEEKSTREPSQQKPPPRSSGRLWTPPGSS